MSGLDKGNTCLGFRKSRPLTVNSHRDERIDASHLLTQIGGSAQSLQLPHWLQTMRARFDEALILDRHFMSDIETHVCIASVDETTRLDHAEYTVDTLRLLYAQKFDNKLNFRELPVSLLRLYFSGQRRFTRCVRKMPPDKLNELFAIVLRYDSANESGLVVANSPVVQAMEADDREFLDQDYLRKCNHIQAYLMRVLDLALTSFEHCLVTLMQASSAWYLFDLFESLQSDPFWETFPIPDALKRYHTSGDAAKLLPPPPNYYLWMTCLWRINVTRMIERLFRPWETSEAQEWLCYQIRLFRDTHLDLLTVGVKRRLYDDESLGGSTILSEYYPSVQRVCCAEELPDFIFYATDNFKTGSNLKERSSLDDKIGHIYINKTGANICMIRNLFDIIIRYGEEHPLIYDSLKNVLKCVLLGNLPKSRGSLAMIARVRINLSFFPEEADAVIPEAEFQELTKAKSLKRKRSKKKTKDELVYTKTRFKLWLLLCRHFVLYLLKEFYFYIANSSQCFADILRTDYKFVQYTDIVLVGNGRCRNIISRQCTQLPLDQPLDWRVVEFEEKAVDTYDAKSGEIKKFHAWALKVARKVQKDDFMKILAKKMTGVEELIKLPKNYTPFYYVEGKGQASPSQRISDVQLHMICRSMAHRRSRLIQTRWFQVMGMTREGLDKLRNWQFCYYTYEIPDNSLKAMIHEFQAHSMQDYMILKTVVRLVEYYKHEQLFHLPLHCCKQQTYALRRLLTIEDWEPTPPELGFAYQCKGCLKFATTILDPLECPRASAYSHSGPTAGAPAGGPGAPTVTSTRSPLVFRKDNFGQVSARAVPVHLTVPLITPEKQRQLDAEEEEKKQRQQKQKESTETGGPKKKEAKKRGRKSKSRKASLQEKSIYSNANVTSCFLNTAFYNMEDGRLYCSKTSSSNNREEPIYSFGTAEKPLTLGASAAVASEEVVQAVAAGQVGQSQMIMRKKDGAITITSSKMVALKPRPAGSPDPQNPQQQKEKKQKKGKSGTFLGGSKEQAAEKLRWLLARREFALSDTSEKLSDSVTALAADGNGGEDLGEAATGEQAAIVPAKSGGKNQKKVIQERVTEAITDHCYTCNAELMKIDMIGVVKNGKVRCTECGSMTAFTNNSFTSHGITCGGHKTAADSDQDLRFKADKRSVKYMAAKREMARFMAHNTNNSVARTATDYGDDAVVKLLPGGNMVDNAVIEATAATSGAVPKNQLHPLNIMPYTGNNNTAAAQSYNNGDTPCVYCQTEGARFKLAVIGHYHKLVKLPLCKSCFDHCRSQTKHSIPPVALVYKHLKEKMSYSHSKPVVLWQTPEYSYCKVVVNMKK